MSVVESAQPELVSIGVLGRPFGLKGEIRVRLFDSDSTSLLGTKTIYLVDKSGRGRSQREISSVRRHQGDFLISLAGARDRTAAEELRGQTIALERRQLPETASDEFYDFDLIGLELLSPERQRLGRVVGVEHPPSNDVLVVELEDGGFTDVPMVGDFLHEVDLESRCVVGRSIDLLPTRSRR